MWLSKGGGMLGGDHQVPSHRFNAGEKGLFWWGVTIPGIFVVGSGLVLDKLIPGFGDVRSDMQIAHMIHATLAIWMMALICGHIYMGTVGMKGAYKAMKTGYVTDEWAEGAPRAVARRRAGRQDSTAAQRRPSGRCCSNHCGPARAGMRQRTMKQIFRSSLLALCAGGLCSVALAKLPAPRLKQLPRPPKQLPRLPGRAR